MEVGSGSSTTMPGVRHQEEVEHVEAGAGAQVEQHVVHVQRAQVAQQLRLLRVLRVGRVERVHARRR